MAQMYTDKLDGVISVAEFTKYRENYQRETHETEKRIEILKSKLVALSGGEAKTDTSQVLEKYRKIDTLTFEIADEFISKIFIGKLQKSGKREIKIEWKI